MIINLVILDDEKIFVYISVGVTESFTWERHEILFKKRNLLNHKYVKSGNDILLTSVFFSSGFLPGISEVMG